MSTTTAPFSISASKMMMENHVAATVLDAGNGFRSFVTAAQVTSVLAIGDDHILRAAVEQDGTNAGWQTIDLSPSLSSQVTSPYIVKLFEASLETVTNTLHVLLAITVSAASGKQDMVFSLSGPAGVDPSVWLLNASQQAWTSLAFDAVMPSGELSAIVASTLQVMDLAIEPGIDQATPSLLTAMVNDPTLAGVQRMFLLNQGSSPVWSYFQQEQTIGSLTNQNSGLATGCMESTAWGVYKLYSLQGTPSLTFLPSHGTYGPAAPTIFTVPAGASAIASLARQANGATYTDLFVAANGSIYYFPYDNSQGLAGTALITDTRIQGVQQLHVLLAGSFVLLWGLNSAGQLFYSRSSLASLGQATSWQKCITLMANVTAASALVGAPLATCGICAITNLPVGCLASNTSTTANPVGMVRLMRNVVTGHWTKHTVPMPTTTDCITMTTYTTRVAVVQNNVPQPAQKITVKPSSAATVLIGGFSKRVQPSAPVTLTTDGSGCLYIVQPTHTLNGLTFTLTLPDGSQEIVNSNDGVKAQLSQVTSSTLSTATYIAPDGTQQKLVTDTSSSDLTNAATCLQDLVTETSALPGAATAGAATSANGGSPQPATATTGSSSGFWGDIGDVCESALNDFENTCDVIMQAVEDGYQFIITIAGEVWNAIVRTAEDAWHAIGALIASLGADIEDFLRFLSYLFDWDEFIAVKNLLKGLFSPMLQGMNSVLSTLQTDGDNYLDNLASQIATATAPSGVPFAGVTGSDPSTSFNSSANPPSGSTSVGGTDLQSDSRVGWMRSQAQTSANTTSSSNTTSCNITQALVDAFHAVEANFTTLCTNVGNDVQAYSNGTISTGAFLEAVAGAIAVMAVEDIKALFDALIEMIEDAITAVIGALQQPFDVPILSALYQKATGSALCFEDLIFLLMGIAVSLSYTIGTGDKLSEQSPSDLSSYAATAQSALQSKLGSSSTSAPAASAAAAGAPSGAVSLAAVSSSSTTSQPETGASADEFTGPGWAIGMNGGLFLYQAVMLEILYQTEAEGGEFAEVQPGTANRIVPWAYVWEIVGRVVRGIIEVSTGDDSDPTYHMRMIELCFNGVCTILAVCGLGRIASIDHGVSFIWGALEAYEVGCPPGIVNVCEYVVELGELPGLLLEETEIYGQIVTAVRCIGAIVNGVMRLRFVATGAQPAA